jgi:hypothetical protein
MLERSVIQFFIDGKPQSELECTPDLISNQYTWIFNSFDCVTIGDKDQVKYENKPVCPYIFKNLQIASLKLDNQVNTFLARNLLTFQAVNDSSPISSNVTSLKITCYKLAVDESVLHPLVYECVQTMQFYRSVGSIQVDRRSSI